MRRAHAPWRADAAGILIDSRPRRGNILNITADTILAVAAGIAGYMIAFNLLTALAGVSFGVGIERIQFGYPPSVRLARIGRTEIRVSPIFFGGHVKFFPGDAETSYAPWPVRALIAIAGPLLAIGICAVLLGAQALDEILLAWPQMWASATDFSTPIDLNTALEPTLQTGGLPAAAAVVAIKVAMFNLLPLPILNGGTFLIAIAEGLTGKEIHTRLPQGVLVASLATMIAFVLLLAWRVLTGN